MPSSDIYGPYFFDDCTVTSILYLNVLWQFYIPQLQENPICYKQLFQ
jgi:hypothetical protein